MKNYVLVKAIQALTTITIVLFFAASSFAQSASSLLATTAVEQKITSGRSGYCSLKLQFNSTPSSNWGDLDILEAEYSSAAKEPLLLSIEQLDSKGNFAPVVQRKIMLAQIISKKGSFSFGIPCSKTNAKLYAVMLCANADDSRSCSLRPFAPMSELSRHLVNRAKEATTTLPIIPTSRIINYRENSPLDVRKSNYFLYPFVIQGQKLYSFTEIPADFNYSRFVEQGVDMAGVKLDARFRGKNLLLEARRLIGSMPILNKTPGVLTVNLPMYTSSTTR